MDSRAGTILSLMVFTNSENILHVDNSCYPAGFLCIHLRKRVCQQIKMWVVWQGHGGSWLLPSSFSVQVKQDGRMVGATEGALEALPCPAQPLFSSRARPLCMNRAKRWTITWRMRGRQASPIPLHRFICGWTTVSPHSRSTSTMLMTWSSRG